MEIKKYITFSFLILFSFGLLAQTDTSSFSVIDKKLKNGSIVQAVVKNGDTSYVYTLKPIAITEFKSFKDPELEKKFKRYQRYVPIVYPYAKLAANRLDLYDKELKTIKSKRKKRKLIKQKEKQLKEEFTDVIKKMSRIQGKILIKLIKRETGKTTYSIIKENRGWFNAIVWQGVAKYWGNDLKYHYKPKLDVEDAMIERVVAKIEIGQK